MYAQIHKHVIAPRSANLPKPVFALQCYGSIARLKDVQTWQMMQPSIAHICLKQQPRNEAGPQKIQRPVHRKFSVAACIVDWQRWGGDVSCSYPVALQAAICMCQKQHEGLQRTAV